MNIRKLESDDRDHRHRCVLELDNHNHNDLLTTDHDDNMKQPC